MTWAALHDRDGQPFAEADIRFGPAALVAEPCGTLWWPDLRTLLIADLHLEKGTTQARRGVLLPPYDSRATLQRLARVVDRYRPRQIVALGDSFHDRHGADRLGEACRRLLQSLQRGRDWLWLIGNHDPEISARVGGDVALEMTLKGIALRHQPSSVAAESGPEIAGHLHPVARLLRRGTTVRRRCFFATERRLVLPAFGAYTGGLNVLDAAFHPLATRPWRQAKRASAVWMCGQEGVYPVDIRHLRGD